ncbi:hypothetical protein BHU72_00705 [Desulfuribacillus stibiiarsenatis]|uniref:Cytochrome C biogenesis protein transmembrane domain-containing protein n=1 Tax=Desulfuribacillus stibiiarsenatis TaxID=1390249 RepID=A0A1E5L9J9_9FIRM|nr:cytochrome c biogenesis protein CcdA [Desulfuribacillus stibiiarsenatis]OEH86820.1 hypothetical protein BHU72_00705 [Desulfuribacillus stibiiarsenatis]
MDGQEVNFLIAFLFGFASITSPCLLPIMPGFLSFITGMTMKDLQETGVKKNPFKQKAFLYALAFVAGFSVVFISLGATASIVGQYLLSHLPILTKVAAVFVFLFGLHMAGIFRFTKLMVTKRLEFNTVKGGSFIGAFLLGVAFSIGWTPCVGPILATILVMASNAETATQGALLLSAYSLGNAVPFLLIAIFINAFQRQLVKYSRYLPYVEKISGYLLMLVGISLYFGWLQRLAYLFY